jgi:hypothetical protein
MLCLITPSELNGAPPVCTAIESVDFKNMTINAPEYGPIKLANGRGYTPRIVLDGKDYGSDWEITIDQDLTLRPEPGVTLRLLNLNADHLLGTGAWGYALMYGCKEGHVRRVFETVGHLYGVDLTKVNEKTFTIGYNVYLKNDPECCASWEGTDTYVWFPKDGAFKRIRTEKGPRKDD